MRYIQKKISPMFFEDFKASYRANKGVMPTYEDFRTSGRYHDLKTLLIEEQNYLCCYCMKQIEDYNSHIEHFIPRSKNPSLALDYYNILASCNGLKEQRENCGHKKDDWYNKYFTVSPLDNQCDSLFTYTIDGHIKSYNKDTRAQETINKLELDSSLLTRARKSAIYICGLFDEDFDELKKNELIDFFNTPQDGKLLSFCNAIIYCLKTAEI